jgi:hypothetical protein
MVDFVKALPQPAKTLYLLLGPMLTAVFIGILFLDTLPGLVALPFSITFALLGLCGAFNVNGTATAITKFARSGDMFGVDYSGTVFGNERFNRFFYALAALIGVAMSIGIATGVH